MKICYDLYLAFQVATYLALPVCIQSKLHVDPELGVLVGAAE